MRRFLQLGLSSQNKTLWFTITRSTTPNERLPILPVMENKDMKFKVTHELNGRVINEIIEAKNLDEAEKKVNEQKLNWRDIIIAERN